MLTFREAFPELHARKVDLIDFSSEPVDDAPAGTYTASCIVKWCTGIFEEYVRLSDGDTFQEIVTEAQVRDMLRFKARAMERAAAVFCD